MEQPFLAWFINSKLRCYFFQETFPEPPVWDIWFSHQIFNISTLAHNVLFENYVNVSVFPSTLYNLSDKNHVFHVCIPITKLNDKHIVGAQEMSICFFQFYCGMIDK